MKPGTLHERLLDLCRRGRLPPALLLAGENGDDLRNESVLLTGGLLCSAEPGGRPCEICRSCKRIVTESHPDARAIRPEGKELKIEQVRDLQRWLQIAPFESSLKVAVIEQAETLNVAAANSLLKTLEEPPPHARIILLARSPETLLATVRSRLALFRYPVAAEKAAEETVDWFAPLQKLFAGHPLPPEDLFDLTETIGKDPGELKLLFEAVEKLERDSLALALAHGAPESKVRKLEHLFDVTISLERETLQRYGNTALCLDRLWLEIQSAFRTATA